ncbi:MAG TPA: porin family protein [Gemmatimonadaceae bacterium]|nr:porin family protein [Gemmatimonadaceae bacterium]
MLGRAPVVGWVLLMLPFAAHGQASNQDRSFRVGIAASVLSTRLKGSDLPNSDSRISFSTGVMAERALSTSKGFRTGVLFSRRGGRNTNSGFDYDFEIDYIEVPAAFTFQPADPKRFAPYALAGAQLGIRVGCSLGITGPGTSDTQDCDRMIPPPELSSTDLALLAGGGLRFSVGRALVRTEVGYAHGLQQWEKDIKAFNRGISFGVVAMLPMRN